MSVPIGPTVAEATTARIRDIGRQIAELEAERKMLRLRLARFKNSTVTEAERRATAAEPFQSVPLPASC